MNKNNFEGAEVTIYTTDGYQFTMDLSAIQTMAVMKLLGVKFQNNNSYSCYSDKTVKELFEFKGNPLRVKEVSGEEV